MLIDVIILLVLVYCAISGYRKGLLMSLMGLVVLVICCIGGTVAQNAFTDSAAEALEPKLMDILQPRLEAQLTADTQDAIDSAGEMEFSFGGATVSLSELLELLDSFGFHVEEAAMEGVSDALAPAIETAARSIAHAVSRQLAGALIFGAVFLILYLALQSLVLAVNVVDRLPVIHGVNHMGGGILGLAEAMLVLTVAAAVCSRAELLPGDPGPLVNLFVGLSRRVMR